MSMHVKAAKNWDRGKAFYEWGLIQSGPVRIQLLMWMRKDTVCRPTPPFLMLCSMMSSGENIKVNVRQTKNFSQPFTFCVMVAIIKGLILKLALLSSWVFLASSHRKCTAAQFGTRASPSWVQINCFRQSTNANKDA